MSSLTSYLARKGAVDPQMLQQALLHAAIHGGGAALNIIEVGAMEEAVLVDLMAQYHRLPSLPIQACLTADPEVARRLPAGTQESLRVLPARVDGDHLVVACTDPPGKDAMLRIQAEAGGPVRMAIASPVAIGLARSVLLGSALDERLARVLRRMGDQAIGMDSLPEDIAGKVRDALARLPEAQPAPAPAPRAAGDSTDDDSWDDLDDSEDGEDAEPTEEPRQSLVGKYIIINRIGERRRRPSLRPDAAPGNRVTDDVTGTHGGMKASKDTTPQRASRPPGERPPSKPPERAASKPPMRPPSVPPSVLKEIAEDYLEGASGVAAPPPVSIEVDVEEPVHAAHEGPAVTMSRARVIETPAVAPPAVVLPAKPAPAPAEPAQIDPRKTIPGAAAMMDFVARKSRPPSVPGYAVEVAELISLPEVLHVIEQADVAADVVDVLHRYALQFFDLVVMMRYGKGRFEVTGVSSRGWAWPVDKIGTRVLGYDQLPETIRKLGQPYLGPLDKDMRIGEILASVGRPVPLNAMMLPISLKGRAVIVVYGDNGARGTTFEEVNDLFHATWVASNRLLNLLEKRRG